MKLTTLILTILLLIGCGKRQETFRYERKSIHSRTAIADVKALN